MTRRPSPAPKRARAPRTRASRHVILFLAANPSDSARLALDAECAAIEHELRMTLGRDDFEAARGDTPIGPAPVVMSTVSAAAIASAIATVGGIPVSASRSVLTRGDSTPPCDRRAAR